MRKRILLVASELDQRAKIARALHSSGFAVELAGDEKRALKLAADYKFPLAIVASQSFRPPNLAMMRDLRNMVPEIIVLTPGADEVAQLSNERPLIAQVREACRSNANLFPLRKSYSSKTAGWI
jgi:DNA-binding response OmpR family regulator